MNQLNKDQRCRMISSLVSSWYHDPCTEVNLVCSELSEIPSEKSSPGTTQKTTQTLEGKQIGILNYPKMIPK